ncbi:MAG: hypothetical protein ABIH27_05160 [Candidatus Omnitrophota bacterium]
MDIKPTDKWYFKTTPIIITFLAVEPLVLPLIWFNPNNKKNKKIVLSIVVSILSIFLGIATIISFKSIIKYYGLINIGYLK